MAFVPRTPVHPLRTAGKVMAFTGVFFVGVALIGAWKPYYQLQQAPRAHVKVLKNDIGYKTAKGFAFQLQMSWTTSLGEQRTQLTTPVEAASEQEARGKYRGGWIVAGQEYDFPVDPADPSRILPFNGYNWKTFGQFAITGLLGFLSFALGMYLVKKGQELAARAPKAPLAPCRLAQLALDQLHALVPRNNHLRNPVALGNRIRRLAQIQQNHLQLAPVSRVHRPRTVWHRNGMLQRHPAPRPHLRLVARRQLNRQPRGHRLRHPRLEQRVHYRTQIHPRILERTMRILRQGRLGY
jgi:hypothetical protein